jgi:hypothetical protein
MRSELRRQSKILAERQSVGSVPTIADLNAYTGPKSGSMKSGSGLAPPAGDDLLPCEAVHYFRSASWAGRGRSRLCARRSRTVASSSQSTGGTTPAGGGTWRLLALNILPEKLPGFGDC